MNTSSWLIFRLVQPILLIAMPAQKSIGDYRLVGVVVKASAPRAEDMGSIHAFAVDFFSGSSHASDFYTGTPVAILPDARRYRVSAGTDRPGVSIL